MRAGGGIYHGRDAFSQTSASGRQPPFDHIPQLNNIKFSDLAPGKDAPFDPNLPQPPVNLEVLDPINWNPESQQWSLGYQYQINRSTTFVMNYVGSHQIHLGRNINLNQVPAADQFAIYQSVVLGTGILDPNTVRPFLGYGIINQNQRSAQSKYHALQVFLNRQLSHGLEFQAAYTWSKSLSNTINQDTEARASPVVDSTHPDLEYAVANQDQPQSLAINYIWELPFFSHSQGILKGVLGGWQFNGISLFRSGLPANVCMDNDYAGLADGGICERPNLVANPLLSRSQRSLQEFFNTTAFVFPQPGTFGDAGRNLLRNPGLQNWDMSLYKNTSIPWFGRESANVQFRAEFFNVWNHSEFNGMATTFVPQTDASGNPLVGRQAGNSDFGTVTSTRDPREIQFGLRLVF
jgi:hypothetical protein